MSNRTDWRFLLPEGETKKNHAFVVGGYDETIETVLATSATHVAFGEIPPTPADLLMVRHTTASLDIAAIAYGLHEGGFLYLEIQRQPFYGWRRNPGNITATLKKYGLTTLHVYGVTPNFEAPRCYLPLASPHVLRWYMETLFMGGTPGTYLAKKGVSRFLRLMAWLLPCYVVVAVKGANRNGLIPSVLHHASLPTVITNHATTFALITSGFDEGSRTILLPFDDKTPTPLATLKIAGHPALNAYTQQEQKTLQELHSLLPSTIATGIPTPLGGFTEGERAVSVESTAKGKPLWTTLYEPAPLSRHIALLMQTTRWLAQFHRATARNPHLNKTTFRDEWWVPLLEQYNRLFPQNSESTLFHQTVDYLNQLPDSHLPIVWQHFDYSPWNIYHDKEHLTTIDWELGRTTPNAPYGPVGCDLLYFLKYWLHAVLRTKGADAEYQAFHFLPSDLPTPVYNACQQAIQTYSKWVEMDTRWIPILTVYGWVEQAVHQAKRQRYLAKNSSTPIPTPKAVHYLTALNRHANSLFTL
jgi:aminoglycoside phosphotransferase (APT) family kinase protein